MGSMCVCDGEEEFKHRVGENQPRHMSKTCELPMDIRMPKCEPKMRGLGKFSATPNQPLLGVPVREGSLWHLSAQDTFVPVTFSLYVNGFAFSTSDGLEVSVSLSPFSLVRNCRFQSGVCSKLKSFKVTLLEPDPCCYFAVRTG